MDPLTAALRAVGAVVAALLAVGPGVAHAGDAGDVASFVVLDASTATEMPGAVGDAGASSAVKTGWCAAEGRRAAGLQFKFRPGATFAALGANSIGWFGDAIHRGRLVEGIQEAGRQVSAGLGHPTAPAKTE